MQLGPEEHALESSLATSAAQTPRTSAGRRRNKRVDASASFLVAGLLSVTRNITKDAQRWVFGRKQAAGRAVIQPLPRAERRWDQASPVPSQGTAAHLLLHLQHGEMETRNAWRRIHSPFQATCSHPPKETHHVYIYSQAQIPFFFFPEQNTILAIWKMCSPPSCAKELLISMLILTGLNPVLAYTNRMVWGLLHLPICLDVTPKNVMGKKKEVGKHMRKITRIFQKVIKEQLSTQTVQSLIF